MEDLNFFIGLGYYLFAILAGIKIARIMHVGALIQFKNDYDTYKRHFNKKWLSPFGHMGKREYERRVNADFESVKQAQIFYIFLPILFIFTPGILDTIYEADWIILVSYIIYVIIVLFPFRILF